MTIRGRILNLHPATLVLCSFLLVIVVGTLLLKLPMATAAAFELAPVYEERGITGPDVAALDAPLLELEPAAEAAAATSCRPTRR